MATRSLNSAVLRWPERRRVEKALRLWVERCAGGTGVSRLAWKECFKRADCNADGKLNIADAVGLLGYLFAGAAPPPEPFKTCGEDPTRDALDCLLYLPCDY